MATPDPLTTTVSTKGQVILPKTIRQALGWDAGTRLIVENTRDGVTLKPVPSFAVTNPADVFACLSYDGPAKTPEDMDAGVLAEARRRHARGRH